MVVAKQYRTFWRRWGAAIIDAQVLSLLGLLENWILAHPAPGVVRAIWFVLFSILGCAYSIYLHGRFGQTLGKHWMRIKVVDLSGQALTMMQAFRRELLNLPFGVWWLIAGLPLVFRGGTLDAPDPTQRHFPMVVQSCVVGLELFSTLVSRQRRALHDFVAGSVVVRLDVPSLSNPELEEEDIGPPLTTEKMAAGQFACFDCGSPVNFGASSCQACEARFVYRQGRPEPEI